MIMKYVIFIITMFNNLKEYLMKVDQSHLGWLNFVWYIWIDLFE